MLWIEGAMLWIDLTIQSKHNGSENTITAFSARRELEFLWLAFA
jgi:hypothetical protein